MTGAQVMSARSSLPPDTALIGGQPQPRPNTVCDPVQTLPQHSVTTSVLSPDQVTSTHSVRQMLCHSALRSSPQPSVSLFLITSPHRLLECIAKSL